MTNNPSAALPDDLLNQLAGLGWTSALMGYLVTVVGVGRSVVAPVVADPVSLRYLGGVVPVARLGLDRLQRSVDESAE